MSNDEMPPGFGPDDPDAPDDADTEYANADFELKERRPSDDPAILPAWIMVTLPEPGLHRIDGFLGLEFRKGVTAEHAERLAEDIGRLVEGISYTRWVT
jgi:hypothetical protein